jgi:hypothetical protein
MTMHLERGLTTTSTRKRKTKITKAQQAEFERGWKERNIRLKEIGLPKDTFEQYMGWLHGTGEKTSKSKSKSSIKQNTKAGKGVSKVDIFTESNSSRVRPDESNVKSLSSWVTGAVSTKPSPVYTGSKVIGIGTMHKSNAVPIFSDDEAKEISTMRR